MLPGRAMRAFSVGIYSLCLTVSLGAVLLAAGSARAQDAADAGPTDGGTPASDAGEAPPQEEPESETPSATILSAVKIEGRLLEPADRLGRFLGLQPGSPYGAA